MDCMTPDGQDAKVERTGRAGPGAADQAGWAERRLSRVGLDLHDGPLQDIALLRGELSALRGCLSGIDPDDSSRTAPECAERLLAKVEDLLAIAEATEADLRELARSLESTSLMTRPLDESLRGIVRSLSLRTGIEPDLTLQGDAEGLTRMERGTLVRVIGEALANAREHGAAESIQISVNVGRDSVTALVADDGCGFDLNQKLADSLERGSIGLAGMIERVRLLGGVCRIRSSPGQGTAVTVSFARYFPSPGTAGPVPALPAWAAAARRAA